ncbi:hypothetical protein ILYODFUR_004653 [Ilyodon furcidens]|uniref:Uncharacterized protein n=1 Tax=Ilyodon furcidens TaxID=33524 RepID=A0ABV0SK74_9TELE
MRDGGVEEDRHREKDTQEDIRKKTSFDTASETMKTPPSSSSTTFCSFPLPFYYHLHPVFPPQTIIRKMTEQVRQSMARDGDVIVIFPLQRNKRETENFSPQLR